MGANLEINEEVIMPLINLIAEMRDGAIPKIPQCLENTAELAEKKGAPALAKSCKAAVEGAQVYVKEFLELMDSCEHFVQIQKSTLEDMGYEF